MCGRSGAAPTVVLGALRERSSVDGVGAQVAVVVVAQNPSKFFRALIKDIQTVLAAIFQLRKKMACFVL
eukprot:4923797-Pyramimonas_sp.AAC.1